MNAGFEPVSEAMFLGRCGTQQAAYQSCRVQTAEALAAAGLYDETVVTVDVWPGAFPNVVIASAAGRLPVAILSTAGFDATRIVPGSLRLASASAGSFVGAGNPGGTSTRTVEVNGDGRADLVVKFRLDRVPLSPNDIIIDVWGRTRGGAVFTGSDVVDIVP